MPSKSLKEKTIMFKFNMNVHIAKSKIKGNCCEVSNKLQFPSITASNISLCHFPNLDTCIAIFFLAFALQSFRLHFGLYLTVHIN